MIRVAAYSLPWRRLAAAALLLGILMEGVRSWPWVVWPLEGIAVGLLAAAVAWCFDEPASSVVDALPRPLWWRTAARTAGIAGLLGVWSVAVWWSRDSLFGHHWDVWVQGLAGGLVGASWVTWRRSTGVRTPGITFAATIVPVAALWALARPFARAFPVFPYADKGYGDWTTSTIGWTAVAALAAVCLALVLSDARWWRVGSPPCQRTPSGLPVPPSPGSNDGPGYVET